MMFVYWYPQICYTGFKRILVGLGATAAYVTAAWSLPWVPHWAKPTTHMCPVSVRRQKRRRWQRVLQKERKEEEWRGWGEKASQITQTATPLHGPPQPAWPLWRHGRPLRSDRQPWPSPPLWQHAMQLWSQNCLYR